MHLKKIAVIGAGTMGSGIAQWFIQQNLIVELIDSNEVFLEKAIQKISNSLESLESKNKITNDECRKFKLNLKAVKLESIDVDTDLVIEAIIENLDAKRKLFENLCEILPEKTIFASNTSSIPITEMASQLSENRRKNFLGLHFFNPAPIMKLVEIIKGFDTDQNLCNEFVQFFNDRKKIACLCNDRPGFIVNRVARNFYGESLRIIENYDLEKIKELDALMKEVGGFKMGPFELMDLIGIDINYSVTESVYKAFFHEPRFRPHKLQKEMVLANRLGQKTKRGFYEY